MSIGWMDDLAEATTYFTTERLYAVGWTALATDDIKTKCLVNAYNRIYHNPDYDIPASPSAPQLVKLKMAQCEYSEYLAMHLNDEDRRKGIQAQGVKKAGIVKEDYSESMLKDMPIPPFVDALLDDFKDESLFRVIEVQRDENQAVDTDVTDF